MADQDNTVEELKTLLETQARTFEERLSRIEASRERPGGLEETCVRGDQPPSGSERAETSGQAGFAASRRVRITTDSLLQTSSV